MLTKDDVTTLIGDTALWWATHWDSPEDPIDTPCDPVVEFVPGGEERFDDLVVTVGLEVFDGTALKTWSKVEKSLAVFASELRFRTFTYREDALHAALNAVSTLLDRAGYRIRENSSWSDFESDFLECLQRPLCYDRELRTCIEKHLERPR